MTLPQFLILPVLVDTARSTKWLVPFGNGGGVECTPPPVTTTLRTAQCCVFLLQDICKMFVCFPPSVLQQSHWEEATPHGGLRRKHLRSHPVTQRKLGFRRAQSHSRSHCSLKVSEEGSLGAAEITLTQQLAPVLHAAPLPFNGCGGLLAHGTVLPKAFPNYTESHDCLLLDSIYSFQMLLFSYKHSIRKTWLWEGSWWWGKGGTGDGVTQLILHILVAHLSEECSGTPTALTASNR